MCNLRRSIVEKRLIENSINTIPFENYDYSKVLGSCCENIIGYVPIPLGTAGPLLIDNVYYQIPMATTEGTLVASTNRGCNALTVSLINWKFVYATFKLRINLLNRLLRVYLPKFCLME